MRIAKFHGEYITNEFINVHTPPLFHNVLKILQIQQAIMLILTFMASFSLIDGVTALS